MTTQLNPELFATIAQKLCNQIIAFQQAIEARAEGQQFPTQQETNQQHKLITCLLRLVKQPARTKKESTSEPEDLAALRSLSKVVDEIFSMPTESDQAPSQSPVHPQTQQLSGMITQRDFEQYGHLLGKSNFSNLGDTTTIKFNGRFVNARWLEYNLLQYCLPVDQRHFIDDARKVISDIDHAATQAQIKEIMVQKTAQKLAA